jgi:hypothetical protein
VKILSSNANPFATIFVPLKTFIQTQNEHTNWFPRPHIYIV